ncbi:hypothetical protein [Clostridium botulinum]|uniref:hypothetical protein n=1 Tax=Clostridium botulinum TaxID=1491 RepID=UPI000AF5994D|nr:hypothetical protein [Clostridium botulinum]MCD3241197.1 hypothetical protein [Clostridium botulinum D/C]MCD3300830.1 hypothetical protein [Clostridium botulinum D/C]MCD3306989.1 hypothetical protein [Clostridium botulinum D/C]MCD3337298.1 hypothetical protein [Clostridium botulinum D/C]MCD3343230.1 hypothetical protein [Clostridium botulinum D/C]
MAYYVDDDFRGDTTWVIIDLICLLSVLTGVLPDDADDTCENTEKGIKKLSPIIKIIEHMISITIKFCNFIIEKRNHKD